MTEHQLAELRRHRAAVLARIAAPRPWTSTERLRTMAEFSGMLGDVIEVEEQRRREADEIAWAGALGAMGLARKGRSRAR